MIKDHYRTVIVGAGPAGLACALTLLAHGVEDVLVAEKYAFPRDKCCAGYITRKTALEYRRLGLDPAECGYSFIRDFTLYDRLKPKQSIDNRFLYTSREINRVALDDAFYRLAKSRGVFVAENTPVTAYDPARRTVTLGDGHSVTWDTLVFADGTMGPGSACQNTKRRNLAMQAIFPSTLPDGIAIHFGVTRRGYCWVSTNNGVTNVGMTDEFRGAMDYKALFRRFMAALGLEADAAGLYAAFTPIGVRKPVVGGSIYYVGDAMGACDPFTLSGVRNALVSGEKAALSIAASDPRILLGYARALRVRFFFTRALMKVFYLPWVRALVFNVGCRFFGGAVAFCFHRFLNKK